MAAGQYYPAEARLLSPALNAHHILRHSSRHTHISQIFMASGSPAIVCCSKHCLNQEQHQGSSPAVPVKLLRQACHSRHWTSCSRVALTRSTLLDTICVIAGSERTGNRPTSSRGSTATGSSLIGANPSMHSPASLQPYSEAEAWLQQAELLTLHGQYAQAKVAAPLALPLLPLTLNELPLSTTSY